MRTHFRFSRAPQAIIATTLALGMAGQPITALACTQVYVGDELTTDGDTYWGRSEDYTNRYGKCFGIEPATKNGKTIQSFENDIDPEASFSYTIEGPTYRYTYVRDTPDNWTYEGDAKAKAYSEAGTNEKGVSVSSTLTTDVNEAIGGTANEDGELEGGVDPRVATGIGEYNIADFVLSQASTAREGVELLGECIDEYGSQDCNQIMIGDANETWNFQQLSGHQWIAIKLADDVVSVNPNMDDLYYSVDLDDTDSCLHSADLVKVAQDAGTYVEKNGSMDVAGSYGNDSESQGTGQNTRYVQGHDYFGDVLEAGTDFTTDSDGAVETVADPELFFTIDTKIDPFTALRSVAARGEGTDVDANENDALYAIGNNRNTESHIFQVRDGLDADIATIQWEALSRSEFSVFVPSYSALLTEVDEDYYPNEADFDVSHIGNASEYTVNEDGEKVYDQDLVDQNEETALEDSGTEYLDYVFMDLNTLAYNNRDSVADGVHDYLDALQQEIIDQQGTVDEQIQGIEDGDARIAFANAAHEEISEEVYEKSDALLEEVRDYVKEGDFSEPFAASDLADDGTLDEPLEYADAMADFDAEEAAEDVEVPVEDDLFIDYSDEVKEAESAAEDASDEAEPARIGMGQYMLFAFFILFAILVKVCGGKAHEGEDDSSERGEENKE